MRQLGCVLTRVPHLCRHYAAHASVLPHHSSVVQSPIVASYYSLCHRLPEAEGEVGSRHGHVRCQTLPTDTKSCWLLSSHFTVKHVYQSPPNGMPRSTKYLYSGQHNHAMSTWAHQDSNHQETVWTSWRRFLVMGGFVAAGIMFQLCKSEVQAEEEKVNPTGPSNPTKGLVDPPVGKPRASPIPEMGQLQKGPKLTLQEAIEISRDLVQRIKDEVGSPGLTVGVSVDGQTVWTEGLGYSDVENRVRCTPNTVLRIASISKSVTMAVVARLWEKGDLDLDKPIQQYVPSFPEKTWDGKKVEITTRQLISHLAGIRHYDREYMMENKDAKHDSKDSNQPKSKKVKQNQSDNKNTNNQSQALSSNNQSNASSSNSDQSQRKTNNEMALEEYYIKEKFESVTKSLELFQKDPLVHKPGTKFLYTSHGWTLISAVVEGAAKMSFEKYLRGMLQELGMQHTFLEENDPIIYNRGRHYVKSKDRLRNAPYVDISYKWAGGGLISNIPDLLKFGNMMLYSYQAPAGRSDNGRHGNAISENNSEIGLKTDLSDGKTNHCLPGFLNRDTVKMLWTAVDKTKLNWGNIADGHYGMGWGVWERKQKHGFCRNQKFLVSHTGAAVGGSSVLLIHPQHTEELQAQGGHLGEVNQKDEHFDMKGVVAEPCNDRNDTIVVPPKGIVVVIIVNMMSVSLMRTAADIADVFGHVQW